MAHRDPVIPCETGSRWEPPPPPAVPWPKQDHVFMLPLLMCLQTAVTTKSTRLTWSPNFPCVGVYHCNWTIMMGRR